MIVLRNPIGGARLDTDYLGTYDCYRQCIVIPVLNSIIVIIASVFSKIHSAFLFRYIFLERLMSLTNK